MKTHNTSRTPGETRGGMKDLALIGSISRLLLTLGVYIIVCIVLATQGLDMYAYLGAPHTGATADCIIQFEEIASSSRAMGDLRDGILPAQARELKMCHPHGRLHWGTQAHRLYGALLVLVIRPPDKELPASDIVLYTDGQVLRRPVGPWRWAPPGGMMLWYILYSLRTL